VHDHNMIGTYFYRESPQIPPKDVLHFLGRPRTFDVLVYQFFSSVASAVRTCFWRLS